MADLTIPKGDYGFLLAFTVQKDDGTAYDLTDYTIKLKVWTMGTPANLIVDAICTPNVPADGTCYYIIQSGDFDTVGNYLLELELTKAGVVESTRYYTLEVKESG